MPRQTLTDADLIARHQAGMLADSLYLEPNSDRPDSLRNRLVGLHNSGAIDLLAAVDTAAFEALAGSRFFTVQQLYCDAIPHLVTSVPVMSLAVAKLVAKGGRDGAAGFPYNAFKQWLEMDKTRAREITDAAEVGNAIDPQSLAIALEALGDAKLAEQFIAKLTSENQLAAISALGRIKPANEPAGQAAMAVLTPFAAATCDENTRYAAISAAFSLLRNAPGLGAATVPGLVAAVAAKPTTECLYALLQALWLQEKLFDRASIESLLTLARDADFTKKGLVDVLDGALQHLLGTAERDLALDFLTATLAVEDGALTLETLDGVSHRLASEPRVNQFGLAVRWFVTANRRLCEAMTEILTSGRERDEPFDATMAGLNLSGSEQIVVCHKAIGFLMLQPVVSASVVIAALRAGDHTIEAQLIELLIYPILINYQGAARDYLAGIKKGDAAYKAARKALKQGDAYAKGAKIDAPIKELWPSDYQRNLAAMKRYDQGREIRRMADEKSIFAKLVHRSTLLYGHKSMTFVGGADKPPVTMELKAMGFELPMPRLDLVDPVGLDWMMRVFRASSPK